jgi:hypothetical protein
VRSKLEFCTKLRYCVPLDDEFCAKLVCQTTKLLVDEGFRVEQ